MKKALSTIQSSQAQRLIDLQRESRERSILLGRQHFLVLQCFHLVCYWQALDRLSPVLLGTSGLVNGILLGALLVNEFKNSRVQIHPFVVFLFASFMRSSVATIWLAAALATGHNEVLFLGPIPIEQFLMEGQLLLTGGDWLFILSFSLWSHQSRRPVTPSAFAPSRRFADLALGLLAFGWTIKLLIRFGIPLDKLGNFSDYFVNFASPAAIYLLFINASAFGRGSRSQQYALFVAILVVELALSLASYMKSGTLGLLIAVALCGSFSALRRKSQGQRAITFNQLGAGLAVALFVLLILFPYSELRRNELWSGRAGWGRDDVISQLGRTFDAAIPGTKEFQEVHRFPRKGFWAFFSRHGDAVPCSWVVQYVDGAGHLHGQFVEGALWNLIPRIIWPDKPPYYPGRNVSVMMGYANSAEKVTTSTGVGGIASSLYLNFGIVGVILGCLLSGVTFALVTAPVVRQMHVNPLATMLYVAMICQSLTHFEGALDGGITVYFYWMIVFLPMLYLSRRIFTVASAKSVGMAT